MRFTEFKEPQLQLTEEQRIVIGYCQGNISKNDAVKWLKEVAMSPRAQQQRQASAAKGANKSSWWGKNMPTWLGGDDPDGPPPPPTRTQDILKNPRAPRNRFSLVKPPVAPSKRPQPIVNRLLRKGTAQAGVRQPSPTPQTRPGEFDDFKAATDAAQARATGGDFDDYKAATDAAKARAAGGDFDTYDADVKAAQARGAGGDPDFGTWDKATKAAQDRKAPSASPKTSVAPSKRPKVKATAANTRDFDKTMALQKKLIKQGADIKADGIMGPNTRRAMKAFSTGPARTPAEKAAGAGKKPPPPGIRRPGLAPMGPRRSRADRMGDLLSKAADMPGRFPKFAKGVRTMPPDDSEFEPAPQKKKPKKNFLGGTKNLLTPDDPKGGEHVATLPKWLGGGKIKTVSQKDKDFDDESGG